MKCNTAVHIGSANIRMLEAAPLSKHAAYPRTKENSASPGTFGGRVRYFTKNILGAAMKEKPTLQEKLARKHVKKPPAVIYLLLINVWRLLFNKKLGVRFTFKARPSEDKNPYILISNHASRVDYLYTAPAVLPHRLNYVVGYNEFFRSHLYPIFSLMQVIPKRNFTPDLHAIKEIIRIIRMGGHICIFPEGMSSISGGVPAAQLVYRKPLLRRMRQGNGPRQTGTHAALRKLRQHDLSQDIACGHRGGDRRRQAAPDKIRGQKV